AIGSSSKSRPTYTPPDIKFDIKPIELPTFDYGRYKQQLQKDLEMQNEQLRQQLQKDLDMQKVDIHKFDQERHERLQRLRRDLEKQKGDPAKLDPNDPLDPPPAPAGHSQ